MRDPPCRPPSRPAFTLVELLVVIGIVAVLVGILLPALSKARAAAESLNCLSNLHQLGIATAQYEVETKGFLPYPVATLSGADKADPAGGTAENMVWFNVLDPYLQREVNLNPGTGVAATRSYTPFKQCPIWQSFGTLAIAGGQDPIVGAARTYKMNTHLRHNNAFNLPDGLADDAYTYRPAKVTEVSDPSNFVYLGDGISIDTTGPVAFTENAAFDMEVNLTSAANPSLRHSGGANILFVDGHAGHYVLPKLSPKKHLDSPLASTRVDSWQSEYLNAAGQPADPADVHVPADRQGLTRNPKMPLQWSLLGKLYRPPD